MPRPIMKFPGGKGDLVTPILQLSKSYLGADGVDYYEPFAGGAAILFALAENGLPAGAAHLWDLSEDIINLYEQVRDSSDLFLDTLKKIEDEYCSLEADEERSTYYYRARKSCQDRSDPAVSAAKYLFINRTTYNGLVRVNADGVFNAPWGKVQSVSFDMANIISVSRALKSVDIRKADFSEVASVAKEGDLVYCDPPYENGFTAYTKEGFRKADHIRLAYVLELLTSKGVYWILSGLRTALYEDLYRDYYWMDVVDTRLIGADPETRGEVDEVLIMNFDSEDE